LGYFPTDWESAKVIPIPKPGKPSIDPGSHRPIGLLRSLSELLERVVAHRLNCFIHQKHILPPEQFGFCQQHSTASQLARITDFIAHRKQTGMVLLDFEKAYHTVWLNGLLFKLILFRLPDYLLFFLKSYLEGRVFTFHLTESTSTPKPCLPAFLMFL
jgi:hypothetical protein